MKGALLFLVAIWCLVASVRCYGGRGHLDPLTLILRNRNLEISVNHVTEKDSGNAYSPVYIGPQEGLKEADKIRSFPGQPEGFTFDQYGGYVTVDPIAGRALFYYFAEAEDPSTKPLVLWLNGGPGCSSLGNGALMELGPFRVNKDGKTLRYNPFAWNTVANVLFLESPAGVGFSYSNRTSDYTTGDKQTAADSYTFLVNWLERFPEYKSRDFFLTGESYAGHYVPQLAQLILKNNKRSNQTVIHLKGIAIGNAFMNWETQEQGMYDFYWMRSLISDEIHEGLFSNCNFSSGGPISEACELYVEQADYAKGRIDVYNIYAPICISSSHAPLGMSGVDPCSYEYVEPYLNNLYVQRAIHANTTGLPGTWEFCNYQIRYDWKDFKATVVPLIKKLTTSGISVWIYGGDVDSMVSVTTTEYDLNEMELSVKTPWYPWYFNEEVGGYVVEYENLTFVTVRGAGHMVPSDQPVRALAMFSSFLAGVLPPPRSG